MIKYYRIFIIKDGDLVDTFGYDTMFETHEDAVSYLITHGVKDFEFTIIQCYKLIYSK